MIPEDQLRKLAHILYLELCKGNDEKVIESIAKFDVYTAMAITGKIMIYLNSYPQQASFLNKIQGKGNKRDAIAREQISFEKS